MLIFNWGEVMSRNILDALVTILDSKRSSLENVVDYVNSNRINGVGDLLEFYVKDAFCGDSFNINNEKDKLEKYEENFSYLGNSKNPPDFIIRGGPAVEVKKIEVKNNTSKEAQNFISLNSSFPKDYLYSSDAKISMKCRVCENDIGGWTKKDIIYAIGNIKEKHIQSLWLIYGDCYAADKSVYDNIFQSMKMGVSKIPGIEFAETKELGRLNKIDPLGVSYLRLRGMWGIAHPNYIYKNFIDIDVNKTNVFILMKNDTYNSFKNINSLSTFVQEGILEIHNINIPNPNDINKQIDAVLLSAKF